jgi:hypothetical protein
MRSARTSLIDVVAILPSNEAKSGHFARAATQINL